MKTHLKNDFNISDETQLVLHWRKLKKRKKEWETHVYKVNAHMEFLSQLHFKLTGISIETHEENVNMNREISEKSDSEFLSWIKYRLQYQHGDIPSSAHMEKLLKLILKLRSGEVEEE